MMNRQARLRAPILVLLAALVAASALVMPAAPASAAGAITLDQRSVAPGDSVAVAGAGFQPNDTVLVTIDLRVRGHAQQAQATTTASATGAFRVAVAIPSGSAARSNKVTARDFHSHTAVTYLTVLPVAFVRVGAARPTVFVRADTDLVVRGAGFGAGEAARVSVTFAQY